MSCGKELIRGMSVLVLLSAAGLCKADGDAGPRRIQARADDSLAAARDKARMLSPALRARGVEVVLSPGEYVLPDGLELDARDGGVSPENPVVWRAAKPGTVRIVGAATIPAKRFAKPKDSETLGRLPQEARGKVLAADVSDFLPPGSLPEWPRQFNGVPPGPLLVMDGAFATLAHWPNAGWTSFSNRVDVGENLNPEKECHTYRNGAFVYSDPRAKRWDFSKGVWLNGFWTHDWANYSAKAGSLGTENGTNDVLRLDADLTYGVMSRATCGINERRFYAFNLPEELDEPGEWWLDRAKKILYVYPPKAGLDAQGGVALVGGGKALLRGKGLKNIRFQDLELARSYAPVADFCNADSVTFRNCRVAFAATDGLKLVGFRNVVTGCEISDIGRNAIVISGGDREKLVRSDSVVEDCRIHRFGVFQKTYAFGIHPTGVGITMRGNELWDAPHTAILYHGNEMLIERNDIHHVLLETSDAGAVYTGRDWTTQGNVLRHNFVHDLGVLGDSAHTMGFYFDDCDCGDEVYGNVFWNVARGIMIGGGRDHPVRGNVFANCTIGLSIDTRGLDWTNWNRKGTSWALEEKAEKLHYREEPWKSRYPHLANIMNESPREPWYNPITDNVFVDCRKALVQLGWNRESVAKVLPHLEVSNNVVLVSSPGKACAKPDPRLPATAFVTMTNALDEVFVDAARGDFRIRPDSPVAKRTARARCQ